MNVKVSDVMTRTPVTVSADSTLAEAANLMIKTRVSGLPVVDVKGAVIGMITQGDLLRRVELGTAGRGPGWLSSFFAPGRAAHDYVRTHGRSVGEVMTSEVISTCADAPHADVRAFSIIVDEPLDWTAFGIWLSMLLNRHGARILRVLQDLVAYESAKASKAKVLANMAQGRGSPFDLAPFRLCRFS